MKTVGLRLTCEGAKEQHGNKSEEGADPQQHTGRVALTDAAQCRLVLPCHMCSAVNQSPTLLDEILFRLIAWELANGEFKTA